MKMLYGHLCMWEEKMNEIIGQDSIEDGNKGNVIENPLPNRDINRKQDKDFVYF